MIHRRRSIALAAAVVIVCASGLFAQKKDDKKQTDLQNKDTQTISKAVDDVAAGTAQPSNDFGLTWARDDAFKAVGNKEFVPFIVTIDSSKVPGGVINYYWRVVAKNPAPAPTPAPAKKDEKKDDKKKGPEYPWEDVNFNVPVKTGSGQVRLARSFTVPPGAYDVFVVAQEPSAAPVKGAPATAPKISVLKHSVTVPDFWNGEFAISTVVVSQRYEPLPVQLTSQQLVDRPYGFAGTRELVPMLENKLTKKDELQLFFLIYNPKTDAANKPGVTVEYNFYAKSAAGEKFFNKTSPLDLNASTLPPQFDLAAGHQLQGGQEIPMASFPEGDYRLEIKVTDTIASKSLTRDVNFSVSAS